MPDYGFGRCDGHHKMIDFRLEKKHWLALVHQRLFTRRVGARSWPPPPRNTSLALTASRCRGDLSGGYPALASGAHHPATGEAVGGRVLINAQMSRFGKRKSCGLRLNPVDYA
jgi:hypothetical protein